MLRVKRLLGLLFIPILVVSSLYTSLPAQAMSRDDMRKELYKSRALIAFGNCIQKDDFLQKDPVEGNRGIYNFVNPVACDPGPLLVGVIGNILQIAGEHSIESEKLFADGVAFAQSIGFKLEGDNWKAPSKEEAYEAFMRRFGDSYAFATSAEGKYIEAHDWIMEKCYFEKLGDPDSSDNADRQKYIKNPETADGDGWYYISGYDLSDDGKTSLKTLFRFDDGARVSWAKCRDKILVMSSSAKEIGKKAAKAKANIDKATFAATIASDICKEGGNANLALSQCMEATKPIVKQCFRADKNIAKTKACLQKKFPDKEKLFTDEAIKNWYANAEKSTDQYQSSSANGQQANGQQANGQQEDSCGIPGIGWLTCPLMNLIASLNDGLFSLIDGFLETKAFANPGLKPAWEISRNIANVLFVVLFLIIIYAQVTGAIISNYSIKSILPRIIIGALLINLSFIICQIAVELSNIAGYNLKEALEGMIPVQNYETWGDVMHSIVGGTVAVGLAMAAIWAIGIPGAVAVLVSMLIGITILIGRQAGVILLTIMSPMAMAAWILPNTEGWFKKWLKMFTGLLLVFPTVSLLFGAGIFASSVLYVKDDTIMIIAALVVRALPLLATPILLKKSMDSLGSIGQIAGNLSGRLSGAAKNGVANSNYMKHRQRLAEQKGARIDAGDYDGGRLGRLNPQRWRSRLKRFRNNNALFNRVTNGYGERLSLQGAAVAAAQDKEVMEAANASISAMNLDSTGLMQLIKHGKNSSGEKITEHQRRAAVQQLAPMMTGIEARELASLSTGLDIGMRKEIASAVRTASTKAPWLGGKSLSDIQTGTYNEDAAMDSYMQEKLSAEDFNTMDAASIDALNQRARAQASSGNGAPLMSLQKAKAKHNQSSELTGRISGGNSSALERI